LERARTAASREGAVIFIALAHLGINDPDPTMRSTYLAENAPWLTAIIDGHCHTELPEGLVHNGVLIAQSGSYGDNIGLVEISMTNNRVVREVKASLIPIRARENVEITHRITPDADILAFIDGVNARNSEYLDTVVMNLPIPLEGNRNPNRRRESYFGNLLMDALRWKTGADVAVFPGPGFRADLPQGAITRGQLLTSLFLDMQVSVIQVRGEAIYEMLETALSAYPNENNYFVQQSGMRIEFDSSRPSGERVISVKLSNGNALSRDGIYTYASKSDSFWILPGGEDAYMENMLVKDYTLVELFIEYVNLGTPITGVIDNRTLDIRSN
jgi:5'-nucleotidase/UDP-sugar diphosphatase